MSEETGYWNEDYTAQYSRTDVAGMGPEEQTEIMRRWFCENYEDPAEQTPFQSSEGGYIWIWGGPYDAHEVLADEFDGIISENVIEELAGDLDGDCPEWAPTPKPEDYDRYIVDDIVGISDHFEKFSQALINIEKLLESDIEDNLAPVLNRMLFVNVITAMETYLSDTFISTVKPDAKFMRKFVESTPDFGSKKIPLSDIYKGMEEMEDRVNKYLNSAIWHRLDRIMPMYKATLDVEFSDDLTEIHKAIQIRHDIVHRNGKTKEGKELTIASDEIKALIKSVAVFIQHVDHQLSADKLKDLDISGITDDDEF